MFAVGVTAGEVDDGPVVVAGALDVLVVVVVVVVEGLLLALLPHAAVNAPAAMIATAPAAAAMRAAFSSDFMSVVLSSADLCRARSGSSRSRLVLVEADRDVLLGVWPAPVMGQLP
jgi:hypothetical protein